MITSWPILHSLVGSSSEDVKTLQIQQSYLTTEGEAVAFIVQEKSVVYLPFPKLGLVVSTASDDSAVVWERGDRPDGPFVGLHRADHFPRGHIQDLQAALLTADNCMPVPCKVG